MKKYWLVLSPDTFIWLKGENGLLYQSVNHTQVPFKNVGTIKSLAGQLDDIDNLYRVELTEEMLQQPEVNGWVRQIVDKQCGRLLENNGTGNRPASMKPVLKLQDVKIISDLLATARKYQPVTKDVLLAGNIYANLGQVYQAAAENLAHHKYIFYKNAADCYRYAQKCFNRHSYPYDFGMLSYRLSKVYYGYWKQSSDVQALRDAVFHLREAEKIFTSVSMPYFWAAIQGNLGLYLSLLGLFSGNDEISMLAVDNYKNRQKIYTKEQWPLEWARAEESIGNIFYNSGKKHDDEEYLEEAIKYYAEAADIYENGRLSAELKQMQICMAKADEYIMQLNRK